MIARKPCPIPSRRTGLTVVEVLVTIAVIGLLAALLLPALQSTRETARAATCSNHLQQIGKGLASFEARRKKWPASSVFYLILPDVGQRAIYEKYNFDEFREAGPPPPPEWHERFAAISRVQIEVYQCPSETVSVVSDECSAASYAGSYGTGWQRDGENGMFVFSTRANNGLGVALSQVTDGTSNTIAMSETLVGDLGMPGHRLRTLFMTPDEFTGPEGLDHLASLCDSIPVNPKEFGWFGHSTRGFPWMGGSLGNGLYNHVLTPNRPSCLNKGVYRSGVHTAGSPHPSSIHSLFADGHVEQISEAIDSRVWRDYGSRTSIRLPVP